MYGKIHDIGYARNRNNNGKHRLTDHEATRISRSLADLPDNWSVEWCCGYDEDLSLIVSNGCDNVCFIVAGYPDGMAISALHQDELLSNEMRYQSVAEVAADLRRLIAAPAQAVARNFGHGSLSVAGTSWWRSRS